MKKYLHGFDFGNNPLVNLGTVEGVSISDTQFGYVGGLDQALASTSDVAFRTIMTVRGDDIYETNGTYQLKLSFHYGGYSHFISTRHNGFSNGNGIDFYTCDGTSAPAFPSNVVHCASMENGMLGIGGVKSPTCSLDIGGDKLRLRTPKTPSSATDTGNAGDFCWDSSYFYVCVATNTWKRFALSSW